ncbi:MAG: Unknown protein [uncultured Sulfurovum sp.]|uniref:Clostripain n=1 Tax=uncultured Sulfurovum sp. TaxID=269237 RepID=A0A6S6S2J6_9BACT|nr:MAG: Unknown protein [uncultured Sulfurovum sp.]
MKVKLTLLIYMAADNNLDSAALNDLESIRKGSMFSEMDIVLQLDRWEFVDAKETIRYHVKEGEVKEIKRMGESNTGDLRILKEFIEESAKAYPSEKLIVIIWSHGSGVDDYNGYEGKRERYFVEPTPEIEEIAIAFDDSAKDFLDNIELQKALDVDVNIDVLGFDACLMGMFEIVYQLRNEADVIVGSQYLEPASGWDYPRVLEDLSLDGTSNKMGEELVKFYADYYKRESYDVTQSAFDVDKVEEVTKNLDAFAKSLLENLEKKKDLKYTLLSSQLFNKNDYIDLIDFVKNLKERFDDESLLCLSDRLLGSLDDLIIANHNMGDAMRDANGVSIYFPTQRNPFKETFEMYEKLDFSKDYPNWIALIRWYYA